MITEETIAIAIDQIEKDPEGIEEQFVHTQYPLMDYFKEELYGALEEEERQLLVFIHLSLFQAYRVHNGQLPDFDFEAYHDHDESNWEVREKTGKWAVTKDNYFKDYPQEDLLAFVEDMVAEEENDRMSPAAREVIFISAKSYIDTICDATS